MYENSYKYISPFCLTGYAVFRGGGGVGGVVGGGGGGDGGGGGHMRGWMESVATVGQSAST